MLVFVKEKVVRRKVTIQVPDDDDRFVSATCYVTWKIVANDSRDAKNFDAEFFKKVISKIEDLVDEQKQPITFTPEFLASFVEVSYVLSGLQREYMNCTILAGRGN